MSSHITAISHHLRTGTEVLSYLLLSHAALERPVETPGWNLQTSTQILSSFLICFTIFTYKKPCRKLVKTNWPVAKEQMSQLMHHI